MPLADFLKAHAEIIVQAVARLRPNRFAVWVIGDVCDADGFFVNLPGLTVEAFEAAGPASTTTRSLSPPWVPYRSVSAASSLPPASSAAPIRTCLCSARAILARRPRPAGQWSSARPKGQT